MRRSFPKGIKPVKESAQQFTEWPAHEPEISFEEIHYNVRIMLGDVSMKLGSERASDGVRYTPRRLDRVLARTLVAKLARHYAGMNYPEIAAALGTGHSSLVEGCNSSLGQSLAVEALCNKVVSRVLTNRYRQNTARKIKYDR